MKKILVMVFVVLIIGIINSVNLSNMIFAQTMVYCIPVLGDCNVVLNSQWSSSSRGLVAIVGSALYLAINLVRHLFKRIGIMIKYSYFLSLCNQPLVHDTYLVTHQKYSFMRFMRFANGVSFQHYA